MRKGITVEVSAADRARLEAVVADRNSPQKHVWRAGIILATAEGFGTAEIMRRTGKSKPCVWRWQARFMTEGVDGLLRDKTRPSRLPPLGPEVAERVAALTLTDPPAETTHWTAAMMAKSAGISVSSVQRIWRAHGLQPHRVRQFKLSNDPRFVEKLRDVVGLYLDPPAHAIVRMRKTLYATAQSGILKSDFFDPINPLRARCRPRRALPDTRAGPKSYRRKHQLPLVAKVRGRELISRIQYHVPLQLARSAVTGRAARSLRPAAPGPSSGSSRPSPPRGSRTGRRRRPA